MADAVGASATRASSVRGVVALHLVHGSATSSTPIANTSLAPTVEMDVRGLCAASGASGVHLVEVRPPHRLRARAPAEGHGERPRTGLS